MSGGPFTVRRAGEADCASLAEVHEESIRTLGRPHYPPAIVEEWARPCVPERYLRQMAAGEIYFLAEVAEGVRPALGFSSWRFEGGQHRTAVYVAGRRARSGVGTALFQAIEATARERGATEVHLSSSVGAVGFYRAMGFEDLGPGTYVTRSGAEMSCVFMRKAIGARPSGP